MLADLHRVNNLHSAVLPETGAIYRNLLFLSKKGSVINISTRSSCRPNAPPDCAAPIQVANGMRPWMLAISTKYELSSNSDWKQILDSFGDKK